MAPADRSTNSNVGEALSEWITRLYELRRDKRCGHERPHKPVLLLTVLDLVESGEITTNEIELSDRLIREFRERFAVVAKPGDKPSIENPFYYLSGDGFWSLKPKEGQAPLYIPGQVRAPKSVRALREGAEFGQFDGALWRLIAEPTTRQELRSAIVARYFPSHADELGLGQPASRDQAPDAEESNSLGEEAERAEPARSAAFRRMVCDLYDFQCAACGLRVRLDNGFTFVDAAHLVPFSESHNDHPSNGLALCKNHHWAMDNFLIAPTPDATWTVAGTLDPRRSPGEAELVALVGQRLIRLPIEFDFRPSRAACEWRVRRIMAAAD